MKALLFLSIFLSQISFAQTNIIAAKSHGSTNLSTIQELDNFGLPSEKRVIKVVRYLKEDCIELGTEITLFETRMEIDTFCKHPNLKNGKIDLEAFKASYPEGTEFIGFEQLESNNRAIKKRLKKEARKQKKSSIPFVIIIGLSFLLYLFVPKSILSNS